MATRKAPDTGRLDRVVAGARRDAELRDQGYRERALKLFPWVCTRCARTFTRDNLQQLTVHHKDHNHDNNPADGSNWELLCIYCHDNEHARYLDSAGRAQVQDSQPTATFQPFANLRDVIKNRR